MLIYVLSFHHYNFFLLFVYLLHLIFVFVHTHNMVLFFILYVSFVFVWVLPLSYLRFLACTWPCYRVVNLFYLRPINKKVVREKKKIVLVKNIDLYLSVSLVMTPWRSHSNSTVW